MDELKSLNASTLSALPDGVRVPGYDRSKLTAGILHVGLGNFHRAHQAWYLHRLFEQGEGHDWAIVGAGVRAPDAIQREKLQKQDWLTTLIELDPSGRSAEVVGSMIDFVPVDEDNAALIARMAQPDIRIVSLTVTEGGYYLNPSAGGFDAEHPDIQYDLSNPAAPKTVFGAMIAALQRRRDSGIGPFTCMSCDNLQGNGAILKNTLLSMATMIDPELATWIESECSFPNSMVDCIVPATGLAELALVRSFGIDDDAPVTHENFRQWVIEDDFCAGRPAWENVGVTFSNDVHVYEAMKLRILNGGHQIVAMPGELLRLNTIDQAMAHPLVKGLLKNVVTEEIAPHVQSVPCMEPLDYLDLIDTRFSNPEIKDTTRRVAFDGSSRQPGFLLPAVWDGLRSGTPIDGLALSSALWCRYCEGTFEDGSPIEPNDPNWSELQAIALSAQKDPMQWLEQKHIYGDLSDQPEFTNAFCYWHRVIGQDGVEEALKDFLARDEVRLSFG